MHLNLQKALRQLYFLSEYLFNDIYYHFHRAFQKIFTQRKIDQKGIK